MNYKNKLFKNKENNLKFLKNKNKDKKNFYL